MQQQLQGELEQQQQQGGRRAVIRSPSPSMDLPRERSACEVDARVSSRGGVVPGGERIIMGASASNY